MNRGQIIDLTLLRVNGGNLTDDGAVQRADIRAYFPIALNFATTKYYFSSKKEEFNRDFPASFYAYFPNLTITNGTVTLPKLVLQFNRNQGIRLIQDDYGNTFTPVQDGEVSMVNYYASCFPTLRLFQPISQTLIKLSNISKFANHVNVTMILDPSEFDDDMQLPIAAGLENDVIDLLVEHFQAQRQQPADSTVDKTDLNSQ